MPKPPARAKYRKRSHNSKMCECSGKRPISKKKKAEFFAFLSGTDEGEFDPEDIDVLDDEVIVWSQLTELEKSQIGMPKEYEEIFVTKFEDLLA